ncbi:MAG: hypothetical protein A2293_07100 [Elusimicrobia bacterium RIFOXYB2_FULL_49_7]|nr:MAG: hypothetical protein A2293_07100 [Elusimicrobia bacterium RIFOXYB2_FULL_49_7]
MQKRLFLWLCLFCLVPLFSAPGQNGNDFQQQVSRQGTAIRALSKAYGQLRRSDGEMADTLRRTTRRLDTLYRSLQSKQLQMEEQLRQNRLFAADVADSLVNNSLLKMREMERHIRLFVYVSFSIVILLFIALFFFLPRLLTRQKNMDEVAAEHLTQVTGWVDTLAQKKEKTEPAIAGTEAPEEDADSHVFFIKVADELHRMRLRIERMPPETKGVTALSNALQRLTDELRIRGYEIHNLTGMSYNDGMSALVRDFIPVDDMQKGERRILRTLRPQVKFHGRIISHGEIEVAMSAIDLAR